MNIINTIISRLEEILVAIALVVATIITFTEVVLRYGFGASMGFTHELAVYLLIFTGLMGSSIGVRAKTHIGVDIILQSFPYKVQKTLKVAGLLVSALFCAIFTVLGFQHAQVLLVFGQVSPEMEIPMFIPKSIIPLAFGLMTFRFLEEAIKGIKTPAEEILRQEEGGHK